MIIEFTLFNFNCNQIRPLPEENHHMDKDFRNRCPRLLVSSFAEERLHVFLNSLSLTLLFFIIFHIIFN